MWKLRQPVNPNPTKPLLVLAIWGLVSLCSSASANDDKPWNTYNNFTNRMLWMTHDRKFILPRGTVLDLAPRLQIPFLRQPPEGLNSDIQLTWHFYMYFDKLGMTSERHPWPPTYPFSGFFPYSRLPRPRPPGESSSGSEAGTSDFIRKTDLNSTSNDYYADKKKHPVYQKRNPRAIVSLPPPDKMPGGERATLIPQLETMVSSLGYDGRSCLLRAVCEIHEYPLHKTGYGLFGEIVTLVFTVSGSAYADSHLPEYLKAEEAGKARDCSAYTEKCTKSLFQWEKKKRPTFR